jgi:HAD superfamily hydrolase (TIGR01549 family)
MPAVDTAIVDIDGTLVDTNYQHAVSWYRAFRRYDIVIPVWRIHRHIGMGGDKMVGAVAGDDVENRLGDKLRDAWSEEFNPVIDEIMPLPGARELLAEIRNRGFRLVLASSGNPDHTEHYLDLLDARSLAEAWTTSKDVEETKPAPDLLQVAMSKVDGAHPVMIGDTTWDCEAAARVDVPSIAILSGGFGEDELRAAGAGSVFPDPNELCARLDDTPLAGTR